MKIFSGLGGALLGLLLALMGISLLSWQFWAIFGCAGLMMLGMVNEGE